MGVLAGTAVTGLTLDRWLYSSQDPYLVKPVNAAQRGSETFPPKIPQFIHPSLPQDFLGDETSISLWNLKRRPIEAIDNIY
jgi:hypothetical protein